MNHTWTPEDHELVNFLTAQGWTVDEISLDTGYSVGSIKRSRGLQRNRISADKPVERISPDKPVERISPDIQQVLDKLSADIRELQRENLRISAELSEAKAVNRLPEARAVKSFSSMINSRSTLNQRELHTP
jgi:hypothetical protein